MKLLFLILSLILSTSIFATKKLSVNIVTIPPNASIFSNNTNYDSQKYHKQKDSFVKRPTEKQTKKIYLFKNGFMLKEYKLDNNSPEKITIELEKAAEFNLSLNTKLDYEISYTPFVDELNKDLQTKSRIFLSETKYFPKNMKSMKLPQGKYYLILSKLGYKTIHKKVNLNKDTVLAIKDVKRSVFALGFEGITEYNVFLNVDNVIDTLYEKKQSYGVLGEILRETGLRYKEGLNLLQQPDKYIQDNKIIGMVGKSGKIYQDKSISNSLIEKIYSLSKSDKKINHKSFCSSISSVEMGRTPHSFRYQFVKEKYNQLTTCGLSHNETMGIISSELNHHRNTSPYYLNKI